MQKPEEFFIIDNPEAVKVSHALCAVLQSLLNPKDYDHVMTLYSAVLFALCGKRGDAEC